MKKIRVIILALVMALACVAITACKKEKKPKLELQFNAQLTAELQQKYDPQIKVKGGQIVSVTLRDASSTLIATDEGYTFTPTEIGNYYYTILIEGSGDSQQHVKTIEVLDTSAPTVITQPTEAKTIEAGVYFGFAQDLESIKITDNNLPMLMYATKKVVAITYQTQTYENANGFSDYLFDKIGEYTIKVQISDVAGNVGYTEYKLNVVDTVKPTIANLPLYYVWLDASGNITVPEIIAHDVSAVETLVTSTKTITNGKISATEGEEILVTYKATDVSQNEHSVTSTLKVLAKGNMLADDEDAVKMFSANSGVLEYDGGISYVDAGTKDVIEYKNQAYTFGDVSGFNALTLTIANRSYDDIEILIAVKSGSQKRYIGSVIVPKASGTDAIKQVLDVSKANLNNVDGLVFDVSSNSSLNFDITELSFTDYADPHVEVSVSETATVGEKLEYTITPNGNEIFDTTVTVKSGTQTVAQLAEANNFTFASQGVYKVHFAFDYGNKIFNVEKDVTVADKDVKLSLAGEFTGARVGASYAIPTATANSGTVTVQVLNEDSDDVPVANNAFTPSASGTYTIKYFVNSVEQSSYKIYAEGANEISFETPLNVSASYNGGFNVVADTKYATSGYSSAKATVSAQRRVAVLLSSAVDILGTVNYVTADVYANLDGVIKLGFEIGDQTYLSSDIAVTKGANEIAFVLTNSLADKLTSVAIKGIYLYNQSRYDNIYYVDSIRFTEKAVVTSSEIFNDQLNELSAYVGSSITIPNPVVCDNKLLSSVTVKISNASEDVLTGLSIGSKVSLAELSAGAYTVSYVASVGSETFTHEIDLTILDVPFSAQLNLGDYYVDTEFTLPDPVLASQTLDDGTLSTATVNKYWRMAGGLEWMQANDALSFNKTGYVDVKYTVSLNGHKVALYGQTYVHAKGVHIDFEKWSGGDHMGFKYGYSWHRVNYELITEEWAYDGKYSMRMSGSPYDDAAGAIAVFKEEEAISLGFDADAMVFWVHSDMDGREIHVDVDYSSEAGASAKWTTPQYFRLMKGTYKVVVPLDRTINCFKQVTFRLNRNEKWYVDNISFVQIGSVEFPNISAQEYLVGDEIVITKPSVQNLSKVVFSEEELANAKFTVEYNTIDGKRTYTFANDETEWGADLGHGTHEITLKCEVGGLTFTDTQTVRVRHFNATFVAPRVVYNSGVDYQIALPTSTDAGVTASAFVRAQGSTEWTQLTTSGNNAQITLTQEGNYEIKFVLSKGELIEEEIYGALVRAKNTLFDFEEYDGGDHFNMGLSHNGNVEVVDTWSADGRYSLKVQSIYAAGDWGNIMFGETKEETVDIGGEYNMLVVKINSTQARDNWQIAVHNGTHDIYSKPITINAGEGTYTCVFEESFRNISRIEFFYIGTGAYYIDSIQGYLIEQNIPEVPAEATEGDTITFSEATASLGSESKQVKVSYKVDNGSYVELTLSEGNYVIQEIQKGTVTVKFDIIISQTIVVTVTRQITVYPAPDDPIVGDQDWI